MFGSSSRASSSRSAAARTARRSAAPSSSRVTPRRLLSLAASAACAASLVATGAAAGRAAGEFEVVQPNSLASAMMMALINDHDVVILDKVENNAAKLDDGRPVWGSILSLDDNTIRAVDVNSNTFCASGGHLGNGSLLVAGGNQAVQYGGASLAGGQDPSTGPYKDTDGSQALRIMDFTDTSSNLEWQDGTQFMVSKRWYPGIETLADGSILLIGGATGGGYINRNYPNDSPPFQGGSLQNLNGGGANPTWEFFPSKGNAPAVSNFMSVTNGLSMYPHTFLMPSGLLFMQANVSTVLWDYTNNVETYLADMPNNNVRVYPASGATAMLPLTPANNYTPTILFCGGAVLSNDQWGNYTAPNVNVLNIEASKDCSSITPETADGKQTGAGYVHEEDLPQGRTMGQFIHLPDGTMVIVNGANKGTAGYSNQTWTFTADGTRTEGMSADPTYQPVLYDPTKPQGQRLSSTGFAQSNIARLYHSSAILIPDGSVLIGGSNPHQDVALTMPLNSVPQAFNTTYELEKWYPPYYFLERPVPTGLPSSILFGGDTWKFKIDAAYMNKDNAANYRAKTTKVRVIRPGFSTHAMNMGQRSLELAVAYTVNDDGSVDFEAMPMPQNKNIFVAGPALLFVVVDGVPSKGAYIQIGSTSMSGVIPNNYAVAANPTLRASTTQSAKSFNGVPAKDGGSSFGLGKIIGVAVGGAAVLAAILLGLCLWRRSANRKAGGAGKKGATRSAGAGVVAGGVYGMGTYGSGNGPEYKRVDTPNFMPGRASMGTFDSYRMNDVGGPASIPGTPGTPGGPRYYDHPGAARAASPLVPGQRSPSGGSSTPSGAYQQQGWGEHQAAGDMGEEYYRDGGYSDPSRLYDAPPPQQQGLAAPQPYGSQQLAPQHAQSYSQQHDYFRGSNS